MDKQMADVNGLTIALCGLATFRLYRLITTEAGPFDLAQKLRNVADPDQLTWVGRGMACAWCITFWLAPLTVYAASYAIGYILVAGLAVSALVGLAVQCSGLFMAYVNQWLRTRR